MIGDGHLPEKSTLFMTVFAFVFAVLATLKVYAVRRQSCWAKWLPSGVAFAVGFLNTPSFSIARLIGGILEYVYRTRYAKEKHDIWLIVIASGFVLGEGVISIVNLALRLLGVGVASCWGCGHGLCGDCPA